MKNLKHTIAVCLMLLAASLSTRAAEWIDMTRQYIQNPDYTGNSNQGWTMEAWAGSTACNYGCQEFWQGTWNFYQTTVVPDGHYRLSVYGYHRPTDNSNQRVEAFLNGNGDEITSFIYANQTTVPLASVYSYALTSNYKNGCWGYTTGSGSNRQTRYYPNNMESAAHCFAQGAYLNELEFDVEGGQLTFGIRNDSWVASNWTIFTGWRLERYTDLVSVTDISLSATQKTLVPGESYTLTATVSPADATIPWLQWESSNTKVATVDQQGKIAALSTGQATITAKATDGSGIEAACNVTVTSNTAGRASLIVNEIQSVNTDRFVDPSWNYGGWVELYNPGTPGVTLTGCWVSDDANNLRKVHISQPMAVPAEGYLCLWFDHHDKYALAQLDMKLDSEGGTFYLSDENGKLILSQAYPPAVARCSYARKDVNGNEWGWSSTPTPGQSNEGMAYAQTRLPAPEVDQPTQVFGSRLTVCVNIPDGATLRYTTDGSTPTANHGQTSKDGLFYPTQTTTYRFCLTGEGYLPSPVVTRTYIYEDKPFALPVISVVGNEADLYGEDMGVFVIGNGNGRPGNGMSNPCNWNMEWERAVNFEYLTTDGTMAVNQETWLERCGGWSRAWTPYSFKIKGNKVFDGQNFLPYDFFPEKPYRKHKTLQIRNGGNDNVCRFKDPALQEIVFRSGLDVDCQAYQPVMHYINGRYAGVINMREPNNKHYAYANYGLDDNEIDQFEMSPDSGYVQKCGTYESMQQWYDLAKRCGTDPKAYEQIRQMVDVDEFFNYMAVEFYLGGTDWPQNNVKGFKPVMEGGKFRFVLFDLDGAFATTSPFSTFAGKQTYTFDRLYGEPVSNITKEIELVTIFLGMMANENFRKQFIDTYCLVAGSVFEPERCRAIINELANRVSDSQNIWNEVYWTSSTPWSTANNLISNLSTSRQNTMVSALRSYAPMQLSGATAQKVGLSANIPEARLLVNDLPVPTNRFTGQLFAPVTFKAQAPAGYKFLGWKLLEGNATAAGSYVSTEEEYVMPSGNMTLQACYEAMTQDELEDEGLHTTPVVINEVSAGNSIYVNDYFKKDDWVELYNTTDKDIDLEGMYLTDRSNKPEKVRITAKGTKAGTIIPAHGYKIIWCSKRDTDTELHVDFKLDNEDGAVVRLMDKDKTWADSLVYCAHNGDQTVGRYPDGSTQVYLMTQPTIAAPNQVNTYATAWQYIAPEDTTQTAVRDMASRNGGMSIAYAGDALLVKSEEDPNVTLSVYTTSGTLVTLRRLVLENGHERISTAELPAGIYVARLRDSEGNECATKFLKH